MQQPHGIWQLATRACPAAFVNNPAAGQQQLEPITLSGTQSLRFGTPGTVSESHFSGVHVCNTVIVWGRMSACFAVCSIILLVIVGSSNLLHTCMTICR
jgi:hypothetical protein